MAFSLSSGSLESGKKLSISWGSQSGASRYKIFVNNYEKTSTSNTSYSTTLDNSYSSVAVKVQALNASGSVLNTITKTVYRTQFVSFSSSGISCSLQYTDGIGSSYSFNINASSPSASFQAKTASASNIRYLSGYTTPITGRYNTYAGGGATSSTTIQNGSNNSIDITTYNRVIVVQAAQNGLKYYFKCLEGVANYQIQVYTGSTLRETRYCYSSGETIISEITSANTVYVNSVTPKDGYTSPYYIYFDSNGSYQSTNPTNLATDNEVSWHNRVRKIQVSATVKPTTTYYYRIRCDGNGGYTKSGASSYTYPTSGSYSTTSGPSVSYYLGNFTQTWTRSGYTFLGWKRANDSTIYTETDWITLTAGEGNVATTVLTAQWEKNAVDPISLFYWDAAYGNNDSSIIASGLPITNLTAARWNRCRAKIKEISNAQGYSYSYTNKSSGQTFTASDFNDARSAISVLPGRGSLPSARNKGDPVMASYFHGSGSLQSALNSAINTYNNS